MIEMAKNIDEIFSTAWASRFINVRLQRRFPSLHRGQPVVGVEKRVKQEWAGWRGGGLR